MICFGTVPWLERHDQKLERCDCFSRLYRRRRAGRMPAGVRKQERAVRDQARLPHRPDDAGGQMRQRVDLPRGPAIYGRIVRYAGAGLVGAQSGIQQEVAAAPGGEEERGRL